MGSDGQWTTVSDSPVISIHPIRTSLRMAAMAELKERGIQYVWIRPGDPGADDFFRYPAAWGLSLAGQQDGGSLYRIR
jgi:hypothetical protein